MAQVHQPQQQPLYAQPQTYPQHAQQQAYPQHAQQQAYPQHAHQQAPAPAPAHHQNSHAAAPAGQLGIYPQYVAQQVEQIVLKEKVLSLSGDSFGIKTVDGRVVLQVKGEMLSLSGRKHVMDANGQHLFDIRKQPIALHATFYCQNAAGEKFFQVKSKFSIGSSKAFATFNNTLAGGAPAELLMKGNFFDSRAEITNSATGQPVAVIDRKFFNAAELIGGQQTYVVTVQPGVDMAMIAAMCICLDEKRNEGKGLLPF